MKHEYNLFEYLKSILNELRSNLEEKFRSNERLDNSIWFTFAALVGQGQDVAFRWLLFHN